MVLLRDFRYVCCRCSLIKHIDTLFIYLGYDLLLLTPLVHFVIIYLYSKCNYCTCIIPPVEQYRRAGERTAVIRE